MTLVWTFSYPSGVSVNHIYRPNGRGGRILTDAARAFRDEIILTIRQSATAGGTARGLPEGDLSFSLDIHPPTHRRQDGDNWLKLICDSVAAAFSIDDSRFSEHHVVRFPPTNEPRLVCWIGRSSWPLARQNGPPSKPETKLGRV